MEEKLAEFSNLQNSRKKESKKVEEFVKEINLLKLQLAEAEEQLITNKKLVAVLQSSNSQLQADKTRMELQTGQGKMELERRLEDLEEELFAYQSNENEKEIKIKQMKNDI